MPPIPPKEGEKLGSPSIRTQLFMAGCIGAFLTFLLGLSIWFPSTQRPEQIVPIRTAQAASGWDIHVDLVEDGGKNLYWSDKQPSSVAEKKWVFLYLTVGNHTGNTEVFGHWRVTMGDVHGHEWYASSRGDALSFSQFRGLSNPDDWQTVGSTARYIIVFDADVDISSVRIFADGREVR